MKPKNVSYYDSFALDNAAVIKATPGTLFSITGYNDKATDQFIQLHDAANTPGDGSVPKIVFKAAAKENFDYELHEIGRYFDYGIVVCNSSTAATKTIGNSDCWFNVQYD